MRSSFWISYVYGPVEYSEQSSDDSYTQSLFLYNNHILIVILFQMQHNYLLFIPYS